MRLWPAGLTLVIATTALLARAGDAPAAHFSLSWVRMKGAETCVTGREVASLVERRLGRGVFGPLTQADVALEGRVEPVGTGSSGRWHVVVSIEGHDGATGTRELTSDEPSCRALDEPIALAIALMVDPDAALSVSPDAMGMPPPAAAPSAALLSAPPPPAALTPFPPPLPQPVPDERWRGYVMGTGALALGLLPVPAPGVLLRAGFAPPGGVAIEAHGALWASQRAPAAFSSYAVTFALVDAGLSLCPAVASTPLLALTVCGGLEGGSLSGRGLGPQEIVERHRVVFNGVAHMRLMVAMTSQVVASLGGGLTVPFLRDYFDDRAADGTSKTVFRLPAVAGLLEAGIGFRSP